MASSGGDKESHLDDEFPRSKITGELVGGGGGGSDGGDRIVPPTEPEEEEEELEPGLGNILEQESLKWIFVGGKGGVGKTTCSCALSVLLARQRESVLLISTDPAHNISDAFDQKFTKYPVQVNGYSNLFAMEINPEVVDGDSIESPAEEEGGLAGLAKELVTEFAGSFPGMDEINSFMLVMNLVKEMQFSVVVFDTAPTGHTVRFLSMPDMFLKSYGKLMVNSQLGGMIKQILPTLGVQENLKGMEEIIPVIEKIQHEFQDPDKSTFICVCIPEFLSLYETERLVQQLIKLNIDVHNIVVNQLLFPEKDDSGAIACKMCASRYKTQSKYLEQILDLYEDFHLTKCPLLSEEVRGQAKVESFAELLLSRTS